MVLRPENERNPVHVIFLMGKYGPLKENQISKTELAAAVLAAKMDKVLNSLQLGLDTSVYCTDSESVLKC